MTAWALQNLQALLCFWVTICFAAAETRTTALCRKTGLPATPNNYPVTDYDFQAPLSRCGVCRAYGEIELFPAIPDDWKDVSFNGFLVWGGLTVDAKIENSTITYLCIKASNDCTVKIKNNLSNLMCPNTLALKKGETVIFTSSTPQN